MQILFERRSNSWESKHSQKILSPGHASIFMIVQLSTMALLMSITR